LNGILPLLLWVKSNAGMGSFHRSRRELVFVWENGDATAREQLRAWAIRSVAGASSFGGDRLEHLASHPTCKPVVMLAEAIRDCSRRGKLVLDPFAGSGSTLIAARCRYIWEGH
jgi:hypothetical protein